MEPSSHPTSNSRNWAPLSPEQLQPVLPQYEILEMLGSGGMGAVYKARQRSLKRLVAIKILSPGRADDGLKLVERFRHEAELLAQMNHPAIVNVFDFGETPDGLLYFVMEFVDGTDVHRMIQSGGKLTSEHALTIAAHVCDALAYAHQRGVIHRDIKPANVLINREGHVKVADFGLAKMHDPQSTGLTLSNMAMGTPDYAAPEVFASGKAVDHRADLYAVGAMLYQMLTGEVPRGMFKLPSQKSGVDPRFDAIIVKAMESNREERYQSASEVRKALDEIRTTPLAKDVGTGALPPQPATSPPQAQLVAQAPSRARTVMILAAIVAMLGGATYLLTRDKPGPDGTDSKNAGANAAAQPRPLPAETKAAAPWQPLFTKPEDFGGKLDGVAFHDGWLTIQGEFPTYYADARQGALRATMRFHEGRSGSLIVRTADSGPDGFESFSANGLIYSGGTTAVLLVRQPGTRDNTLQELRFPLSPPIREGEAFTMELRAEKGRVALLINGRQVGDVEDRGPKTKRCFRLTAPLSPTEYRDIAWQNFGEGP